jgi:hypothetical protein
LGFENGFQLLFVPFYGKIIPIEEDSCLFFVHAKQIKMAQVNQSSVGLHPTLPKKDLE